MMREDMSETLLNLFHAYRAPMNNAAVVKGSAASVRVCGKAVGSRNS